MQADWWTLALQAINALVLIWLLQRFLFRPTAKIIAARREAAARLLSDAEATRADAEAEREEAQAEATKQADARAGALKAAEAEAEALKAALMIDARAEADRLGAAAEAGIARTRKAEAAAAADHAGQLATDIAAKLLQRLPAEAQVAGFIAGLAEGMAKLPEEVRIGFAADGAAVRLRAPRALTRQEAADCRAAIGKALGQPVEIVAEVDPSIIAGLEAEGQFGSVHNSFRADLKRLTEALTRHDQ